MECCELVAYICSVCCVFVVDFFYRRRFAVQHLDMLRRCGFVVDCRSVANLSRTYCGLKFSISCIAFAVDFVVQFKYCTTNPEH